MTFRFVSFRLRLVHPVYLNAGMGRFLSSSRLSTRCPGCYGSTLASQLSTLNSPLGHNPMRPARPRITRVSCVRADGNHAVAQCCLAPENRASPNALPSIWTWLAASRPSPFSSATSVDSSLSSITIFHTIRRSSPRFTLRRLLATKPSLFSSCSADSSSFRASPTHSSSTNGHGPLISSIASRASASF